MRRLNPFTGLRPRIAVLVLGGVLLLAALMMRVSGHSVDGAYERAARGELMAIATTWEDGFALSDLADPQLMQQRVVRLKERNPNLDKIAVSWHDVHGATRVAETHGASTGHDPAIDAGEQGYRDVRSAGGHHAEIHYPVGPGPDAMLELHYDLTALDQRPSLRPHDARRCSASARRSRSARSSASCSAAPSCAGSTASAPSPTGSARATTALAPTFAAVTRSPSSRATSTAWPTPCWRR